MLNFPHGMCYNFSYPMVHIVFFCPCCNISHVDKNIKITCIEWIIRFYLLIFFLHQFGFKGIAKIWETTFEVVSPFFHFNLFLCFLLAGTLLILLTWNSKIDSKIIFIFYIQYQSSLILLKRYCIQTLHISFYYWLGSFNFNPWIWVMWFCFFLFSILCMKQFHWTCYVGGSY